MSICLHGERPPAAANVVDFELRGGSQDKQCFDEVFVNNQYRLADSLAGALVIDIGANVGAFAVACLMRGAEAVACFEPCRLNCAQAVYNTKAWPGQVPIFNVAVWRSDKREAVKFVNPGCNTACGAVTRTSTPIDGDTVAVDNIGLDEILKQASDDGKRRIDILKIDAEGAEYPILYTATRLDLVDCLLVETHEYPAEYNGHRFFVDGFPDDEACADGMEEFLRKQGFIVERQNESEHNRINTLFFAKRKN